MKATVVIAVACFALCAAAMDPVHNTTLWEGLLAKYVHDGELQGIPLTTVDYMGFSKDSDMAVWIDSFNEVQVDNLTHNEFYAFMTNAYNTLAINMILTHPCNKDIFGSCGPINGIRDIGSIIPFSLVWNKPAGKIGGKVWTLQEIEDRLRNPTPYEEDPRLHSAIVCASISCPNIAKHAYTVDGIDAEFNASWNNFMSNEKKGMLVNQAANTVELSSIFNWFSSDFAKFKHFPTGEGSVIEFILLYLSPNHTDYAWLQQNQNKVTLKFFKYNWDANASGKLPCDSANRPCYPLWALLVTLGCLLLLGIVVAITLVVRHKLAKKHAYRRIEVD